MRLLTVKEAADLLSVRPQRVYELALEGLLPVVRLGRQVRIDEDALFLWVREGGQGLPGGWRREPAPKTEKETS